MPRASFLIRTIATKDIAAVEHLLAVSFGNGFMVASAIDKFVDQLNYNGLVAVSDNLIMGVALARIFPIDEIKDHLKLDTDQVQEIFPVQSKIGIIHSMAILPRFTGKGIGLALMVERMKWFDQSCEAVICMCWEESNGAMAKLLIRNGFQHILRIPEYWKADSLSAPFNCASCGSPPCLCSASIYVKQLDSCDLN
jgi:ribosomal protein S18 acetylase RimI-like enzyme